MPGNPLQRAARALKRESAPIELRVRDRSPERFAVPSIHRLQKEAEREAPPKRLVPVATEAPAKRVKIVVPPATHRFHSRKHELIGFCKYLQHKSSVERAENYTPYVGQYYSSSRYRINVSDGEARLRRVEATLRGMFPDGRFEFQIKLHSQVMRAVMRQVLRNDYARLIEKVCRERGWDGPKKNLFTIASRRSGKTTGMASLVAALLVEVPHIQIVVYSVALRTAQEFVRLVERYICSVPGGSAMIKNPGGSETLIVEGPEPGDTRRIRSFPSGGNAKNVSSFSIILPRFPPSLPEMDHIVESGFSTAFDFWLFEENIAGRSFSHLLHNTRY